MNLSASLSFRSIKSLLTCAPESCHNVVTKSFHYGVPWKEVWWFRYAVSNIIRKSTSRSCMEAGFVVLHTMECLTSAHHSKCLAIPTRKQSHSLLWERTELNFTSFSWDIQIHLVVAKSSIWQAQQRLADQNSQYGKIMCWFSLEPQVMKVELPCLSVRLEYLYWVYSVSLIRMPQRHRRSY
jgi:hypothetical protein